MTYEYECQPCGNNWEEVQSIVDAPIIICPRCGRVSAKRLISKPGEFLLKGGGWYADGYGRRKATE